KARAPRGRRDLLQEVGQDEREIHGMPVRRSVCSSRGSDRSRSRSAAAIRGRAECSMRVRPACGKLSAGRLPPHPMPAYELLLGLRYPRAKRRNHFISFISATSMAGIALGVAALIVVLSVMNGFQHELRDRILSVASHIEVRGFENGLADWPKVALVAQQ